MKHIITAECMSCHPWVRLWPNAVTNIPVRQTLHEPHCPNYPKLSRSDLEALSGD